MPLRDIVREPSTPISLALLFALAEAPAKLPSSGFVRLPHLERPVSLHSNCCPLSKEAPGAPRPRLRLVLVKMSTLFDVGRLPALPQGLSLRVSVAVPTRGLATMESSARPQPCSESPFALCRPPPPHHGSSWNLVFLRFSSSAKLAISRVVLPEGD